MRAIVRAPAATVPQPLPRAAPSAPAHAREAIEDPRRRLDAAAVFVALFIALHFLLDIYLKLAPGQYLGLPGTQLLETFLLWIPPFFIAAYVSLGTGARIHVVGRFAILAGYAGALIACILLATNLRLQWAEDTFFLLFRLAPIPSFLFLFADGRRHWSASRCFGLALMFALLWRTIYLNFPDLLVIASGGATLPPTPANRLYISFFVSVLWDLVYPILGLMFFFHRVPGIHIRPAWGDQLKRLLQPIDAWVRKSPAIDVAWGAILFPLNLIAAVVIATLLARGPTGSVGDDSQVFSLITLDQVFIVSIVAGVGEELVFRGLLQNGLMHLWGRDVKGSLMAIFVSAVPFGVVHAGYADLDHIIAPFLFGLFIGAVYRLFGIIPAMLIHTEIDVFAFGFSYGGEPMGMFLTLLFMANIVFGVIVLAFAFLTWWQTRRRALAAVIRA